MYEYFIGFELSTQLFKVAVRGLLLSVMSVSVVGKTQSTAIQILTEYYLGFCRRSLVYRKEDMKIRNTPNQNNSNPKEEHFENFVNSNF